MKKIFLSITILFIIAKIFAFNFGTIPSYNLKEPIDRKMLGYFFYQTDFNYSDVIERINDAVISQEDVLILGFHRFENSNNNYGAYCKPEDFRKVVQYVHKNNFRVMTIKNMLKVLNSN